MSKKKKPITDPHAEREASIYANPIASRELILDLLTSQKTPSSFSKLCKLLDIQDKEQTIALQRRLGAMIRDSQISQNRNGDYLITDKSQLVRGKVSAHKDGYGFLISEDGGEDLFLPHYEMRKVFHGDEVLAAPLPPDRSGRIEAEIIEVTQRNTHKVVGKLFVEGNRTRVVPENPKIQHTIFIDQNYTIKAEHEQIVVVEITEQPEKYRPPKGIIVEVLGNLFDPGMEIEIAKRSFGIPFEWPQAALDQAARLAPEPDDADKTHRVDIRQLPLVTIDGEDAKDFDDAVFCQKKSGGGWRLWVAIADVSHYVTVNSALDQEAHLRGTSVYFPEHVVPMLPEKISNGLCSLKPGVDRLCMICEMTISASGRLSGYRFYEGVMHSHARLTYTEVSKILAEKSDETSLIRQSYQELVPHIDELHNLYHALREQRTQRGAIDFETEETRFIFNAQRKVEEIIPLVRNDAHKLIEECMLCANVATARFLQKHNIPALFRVHEGPTEKKLNNLQQFIGERGLFLSGGIDPKPSDYQKLFQQLEGRTDGHLIQTMMLRSMSQAVYEPENHGHFGLAYPAYTHFTSPIRRYPDLLVHRAIRSVIRSNLECQDVCRIDSQLPLDKADIYPYVFEDLVQLGEHCSMTERRADDATRDVSNWLKCEYLQEHIGSHFPGIITSVTSFGLFVELGELYAEGLVHISQLGAEYFHYDAAKQRLIGENSHRVYNLGDSVEVVVSRVDLDERKVHLSLANTGSQRSGPKAAKGSKQQKQKQKHSAKVERSSKSKKPRKGKKR